MTTRSHKPDAGSTPERADTIEDATQAEALDADGPHHSHRERNAAHRAERTAMTIDIGDFRVQEGAEVDLKKRPTAVAPVYQSKDEYRKLLKTHVERLGSQQERLYASDRYAVLLI